MYVKYYMTENPVTIDYNATISDAVTLMNETEIHRIPVLKEGRLVGIITDGNIQKASPSKATSLSIYEINYLLSKTKVADYMTKSVVTCTPNILLEEAMQIMTTHKVSCLPVLEGNTLVGIITETDMFNAFIDLLGFNAKGSSRITLDIKEDRVGVLAEVCDIFKDGDVSISNIAVYRQREPIQVVIRVDTLKTEDVIKKLEEHGFSVSSVVKKAE